MKLTDMKSQTVLTLNQEMFAVAALTVSYGQQSNGSRRVALESITRELLTA